MIFFLLAVERKTKRNHSISVYGCDENDLLPPLTAFFSLSFSLTNQFIFLSLANRLGFYLYQIGLIIIESSIAISYFESISITLIWYVLEYNCLLLDLFSLFRCTFVTLTILIFLSRMSSLHFSLKFLLIEKKAKKKTLFDTPHLFSCKGQRYKKNQTKNVQRKKKKVWTTKAKKKLGIMFSRDRLRKYLSC